MLLQELIRDITLSLIAKSGVREWEDEATRQSIGEAALALAQQVYVGELGLMAVTAVFREQAGTEKTFKSSGGSAAITLASLANTNDTSTGYRQSAKLDLGATWAQLYCVKANFELAATPTAGAVITLFWAPSTSGTAGTDNPGNCSGTDSSYTGYSNNNLAASKQLMMIGNFVCTAQATATVQSGIVGYFSPPTRYGSLVVRNASGAAMHTSDSNCVIFFEPVEFTSEPS